MSRLEHLTSLVVLAFGLLAIVTGVLGWSISAMVLGSLLVLAAMWFRRSITVMLAIKEDTRQALDGLAFIARVTHRDSKGLVPDALPDDLELVK